MGGTGLTADDVDMDPEAWLDAQPDIDTSLDFDLDDQGEEYETGNMPSSAGKPSRSGVGGGGGVGLGRAARDALATKGRSVSAGVAGDVEVGVLGGGGGRIVYISAGVRGG